MNPGLEPPTAVELISYPVVRAAMELAWNDSLTDEPAQRHEEGGWIYMDTTTGEFAAHRAIRGGRASLSLANPPYVNGSVVVGTFHTHPNPTAEGWEPGPSAKDTRSAAHSGVTWLVRADN